MKGSTMEAGRLKLLAIDDNPDNLKSLKVVAQDALPGCVVCTALNGPQGIELARVEDPDVILLDIVMPGMDGFEVCARLKADEGLRAIPVVFLTALRTDRNSRIKALETGAEAFLSLPFDDQELIAQIRAMAKLKAANRSGRLEKEQLAAMVAERTAELEGVLDGVIQVVAQTVDSRDPYTAGHQRRVAQLARDMAREMGLSPRRAKGIQRACMVHDVGKVSVPAEILNKPGRLSDLEFALVKVHPRTGYEILKGVRFQLPIAEAVYQHHERMDGSGYPRGLKGEEIMLEARIMGVADVVEAMASHRPYRAALGLDAAMDEISSNRGVLYDARVVDACLTVVSAEGFELDDL
jgi:putative two-component system response regulator